MSSNAPKLPGMDRSRRRSSGRARRAVDTTVKALRADGLLTDQDEDLVALYRLAADGVDHEAERLRNGDASAAVLGQLVGRATALAEVIRRIHPATPEATDAERLIADVYATVRDTAHTQQAD